MISSITWKEGKIYWFLKMILFLLPLVTAQPSNKTPEVWNPKSEPEMIPEVNPEVTSVAVNFTTPLNRIGIDHPFVCANFDWWPELNI